MPPSAMIAQIMAPGLFMTIHLLAMAVQTMPGKFTITLFFLLKFRYSEKASKIWAIFHFLLDISPKF